MVHERLAVYFEKSFTTQPDGDLLSGSAAAVSFLSSWLNSRFMIGGWIYIPGFIMGLGGSFMTAYKLYLAIMKTQKKKKTENMRKPLTGMYDLKTHMCAAGR